jgi:hypothetical protein
VAEEAAASPAAVVVVPSRRPRTLPRHRFIPCQTQTSAAVALSPPGRASLQLECALRIRFGSSMSSAQTLPVVASMGLEPLIIETRRSNAVREHAFARRSADWHRDWDRRRDHWWHGHRCRFVDGEWFIFDTGFPWYPYGYPYDYYAYESYPYEYDAGVYEGSGADYYGQGAYDSSEQYADSTVATAQEQLARQGYYRGEIDGILGPETRRAVMRYQGDHGLRLTGSLNTDTLHALGLPRVANN